MKKLSIKNIKRLTGSNLNTIVGGGSRARNGVIIITTKRGKSGASGTPG